MQDIIQVEIQTQSLECKVTSKGVEWVSSWMESSMVFTGASFFIGGKALDWDLPVQKEVFPNGTFCYRLNGQFHCPFEPAYPYKDGTPLWALKGRILLDVEVATIKSILSDIKLAPGYINDPIYMYTAKHLLK